MGWEFRIKNFNIIGVHWKFQFLEGECSWRNQYIYIKYIYIGVNCGCLDSLLADLKGCLAIKRGWCFWGVLIHWYVLGNTVDVMTLYINFLMPIFA